MKYSIIIPVYNDREGINVTVASLLNQDFSKEQFELIVVDNNSSDRTFEYVQKIAESSEVQVTVLSEYKPGSYAARNKGVQSAKGEYIIFIDSDMWVDNDFLSKVSEYLSQQDAGYIGCNVRIVVDKENFYERFNAGSGFPNEEYIRVHHFAPTAALIVKRGIINTIGLFDEELVSGGDREFGERVFAAGMTQQYANEMIAYHPARKTFNSLKKKYIRIGRGVHQLASRRKTPRHALILDMLLQAIKPINPIKYYKKVMKNIEANFVEFMLFYCLEFYLSNLCVVYGRLYEIFATKKGRVYV